MRPMLKALIVVDVWIFRVITFGRARPGETMSAAAWHLERRGKWQGKLTRPLIDFLFRWMEKDHCRKAWQWQAHIYAEVNNG